MASTHWKLTVLLIVFVAGCSHSSERKEPVYPVDGQLLVDGKPAAGAVVTFHPMNVEPNSPVHKAIVREDGRFAPTQLDGAIGLVEGTYALTATWPEDERDLLDGKYADPGEPIAEVTVKVGINLLRPIKLTR